MQLKSEKSSLKGVRKYDLSYEIPRFSEDPRFPNRFWRKKITWVKNENSRKFPKNFWSGQIIPALCTSGIHNDFYF
jgi:hypothetical protein